MWRPIFSILFFAPPLFANTLSFTCMEFIVHAEGIYLAFAENQQSKVTETYHYNTNSQTIDVAGTLLDCQNQNEIIHCNHLEKGHYYFLLRGMSLQNIISYLMLVQLVHLLIVVSQSFVFVSL